MSASVQWLKPHSDGVRLQLKVIPRSSRNQIDGLIGDRLKVRITAPPVDSAANDALVKFLAGQLDLPKSSVELVAGTTSRNKTVLLRGLCLEEAVRRLGR